MMISESVLNFLMEIGVLSFVLPVGVLLVWRLRTHKSFKPAVIGALVYLCFGILLTRIPDTIFLYMIKQTESFLRANPVCYALYTGIVAALFEETGRFLVYKFYLNNETDRYTAISMGIGHGGLEWMISLGFADLSYYVFATVYNQNKNEISDKEFIEVLTGFKAKDLVMDGVMQIFFFCIQICLSVMVLQAYRNVSERIRFLSIAAVTHIVAYLPSGLYKQNIISHMMALILLLAVLVFAFFFAKELYKGMREADKKQENQKRNQELAEKKKSFSYAKQKYTDINGKK